MKGKIDKGEAHKFSYCRDYKINLMQFLLLMNFLIVMLKRNFNHTELETPIIFYFFVSLTIEMTKANKGRKSDRKNVANQHRKN